MIRNITVKTTLPLIILISSFFLFSCYANSAAESSAQNKNSSGQNATTPDKISQHLWIESLRTETHNGSDLTFVKTAEETKTLINKIISYKAGNLTLYALLSIPKQKKPASGFPVIIVNHGHIPQDSYSTLNSYKSVTSYYAANGFLVLKPDYRGHASSAKGNEQYSLERLSYPLDVLALLSLIPEIPEADPDNIFMYGHSMGGQITLTVLEVTDKIKAASLWAPVSVAFPESSLYFMRKHNTKLADELKTAYNELLGEENYSKFSPIAYTQYIKSPLIIQHGTTDESVPYSWTLDLLKVLDKNNIPYTFYSYENENHNLGRRSFYTALKRDVDFFRSHMKTK
jgi:dipeptidyl aminopeptidase/acylaminoacyl peptidase